MAKNKPSEDGSRGVIIMTSGFAANTARKGHVGISACYGGINSMTLPMSRDLGPLGIRVATISPGTYGTNSLLKAGADLQYYYFKKM